MAGSIRRLVLVLATTAVLAAACGSGSGSGPGSSTACGLGGTADEAVYAAAFRSMDLVNAAGASGTPDPDAGVAFPTGTRLSVRAEAVAATTARMCVATRDQAGTIRLDVTGAFAVGSTTVELGVLDAGSYVVRVGVGGVLVRNLPFAIR